MINSSYKVSVVLPVFNGEQFVSSAIRSVISQTHNNWELLIIDDGSTDTSASICDSFSAEDARILVFHQNNGGVNSARAKGIDAASGDYISFLDADDTLPPDALEHMLDAFSEAADIVCCGKKDCFYTKEEYIIALWKGEVKLALWSKLFRTALFKGVDYSLDRRLVMGEDLLLNAMIALEIKGARSILNECYLVNHNNDSSVTKTFKHNWNYEKYYFSKVEELFLNKCSSFESYEQIELLVNKCWLNAIKYVMLDGGSIDYKDKEFLKVQNYFSDRKNLLGPSEKLIFILKNPLLYRIVLKLYMRLLT